MLKNLSVDTVKESCRTCLRKLQTDKGQCVVNREVEVEVEGQGQEQKFIDISCDVSLQQFIATHVDSNVSWHSESVRISHLPQFMCTLCYEQYLSILQFIKQARNTAEILHVVCNESEQQQQQQQLLQVHNETALPTSSDFERELEFLNEILPNIETETADIENITSSLEFVDSIENINTTECDILSIKECDTITKTSTELKKKRSRVAAFRCELCKRRFVHKYNLEAHILRVHKGESRPFACMHCDKKYKTHSALRYHERVAHNRNESLQCKECGKHYRSEVSLRLHRMQQHLGQKRQKRYVCETCGSSFLNPKNLHIHRHVKHEPMSEKYKCKVCAKKLHSPYSLKYHMLRHHQTEQNYVCGVCNAGFARRFMLASHMRNHMSESEKFPCGACDKRFLTAADVERHHRLVHLKIKPHVCKQCGEAFGAIKTLRHHMYRHTGEKPYVCEICGLGFRQPTSMKTHRKLHLRENNDIPKK